MIDTKIKQSVKHASNSIRDMFNNGLFNQQPSDIADRIKYTVKLVELSRDSNQGKDITKIIKNNKDIFIGLKGRLLESIKMVDASKYDVRIAHLMAFKEIGIDLSKENPHLLLDAIFRSNTAEKSGSWNSGFSDKEMDFLRSIAPDLKTSIDHLGISVNDFLITSLNIKVHSVYNSTINQIFSLFDIAIPAKNNQKSVAKILAGYHRESISIIGEVAIKDKLSKEAISNALNDGLIIKGRARNSI